MDKRVDIARKVRGLRKGRGWTQAELARELGVSQNWLSELERGAGSFTAEQFLTLLRLFNVSVAHFADQLPPSSDLQNALSRLGATHLQESVRGVPSVELAGVHEVIREALLDATPRLVTALAPVLVNHAPRINFWKLMDDMRGLGRERRVPWLVANTEVAIDIVKARGPARTMSRRDQVAKVWLEIFVSRTNQIANTGELDVLDQTVGSLQTLKDLVEKGSSISSRWSIVTALQPEDFAEALELTR